MLKNPKLKKELKLTHEQLDFFTKGNVKSKTPDGLTWHHHQDVGKMQLVDEDVHRSFKHTGGMSIWGGGY